MKKEKKGFFKEFKEFIARGNVFDLAVGVIIGGAFTAIVNALCDNILKPIINWILALILGQNSLDGVYTFLKKAYVLDEAGNKVLDVANSIFIDWGSFINAIINFLLIALVLFLIIKAMMAIKRASEQTKEMIEEKQLARAEKQAEEKAKKEAEINAIAAEESADGGENVAPEQNDAKSTSEAENRQE